MSDDHTTAINAKKKTLAVRDKPDVTCVIGAGASGITAAKNLMERGLPVEVIERNSAVGGLWIYGAQYSSVYDSAHLISSKRQTEYTDFPMPEGYPPYPNHAQVLAYLRRYAEHFNVMSVIRFNTTVTWVERTEDGRWQVTFGDGTITRYGALIIANGHHWDPRYPPYHGEFGGTELHASEYKTPDILKGKRVLVIGGGNSGCDIAVEAALHADLTYHSTRRGYWYIPKFLMGQPADEVNERMLKLGLPLWLRRLISTLSIRMVLGRPQDFGLRPPDHKLLESHPIVNSQLFYHVGHGEIIPKPDVQVMHRDGARFTDNSVARVDVVIYATGYRITFPFIDRLHMNWAEHGPNLWMHIFHPQYDNLFVAGLIQPDSGQFGLVDTQCQLIAAYLHAKRHAPHKAERFRQKVQGPQPNIRGGRKIKSARHHLEVEHYSYRKHLTRLIKAVS